LTFRHTYVGGFAVRWGSRSEVGNVRALNEDAWFTAPGVFIVADGMGGHDAGEVASALAVEAFRPIAMRRGAPIVRIGEIPLIIEAANTAILDRSARDGCSLMGTTLLGLVIAAGDDGPAPVVFHIGDSRCYERRNGRFRRVTADHSEVQELIDAGLLTDEDARTHPAKNVVTRSLGYEAAVVADFTVLESSAARLLLCSDGLTAELTDDQIAVELSSEDQPHVVADRLVERALDGAARDNITAVVVDVLPAEPPDDDDITEPRVVESNLWAPNSRRSRPPVGGEALLEPLGGPP